MSVCVSVCVSRFVFMGVFPKMATRWRLPPLGTNHRSLVGGVCVCVCVCVSRFVFMGVCFPRWPQGGALHP